MKPFRQTFANVPVPNFVRRYFADELIATFGGTKRIWCSAGIKPFVYLINF